MCYEITTYKVFKLGKELQIIVSRNIYKILKERNLSQVWLANKLEMNNPQTLNAYLRGRRGIINLLEKIALVFEVPIEELIYTKHDPLESRCLAACRQAKELGLEPALLEHLDMIEYKIEKASHDPPVTKAVANLKT